MSSPSSPDPLAIHLDAVGGIAGDMFVAAMIDALPDLAAPVLADLAAVRPEGCDLPSFSEGASGGLRVRRFGLPPSGPRTAAHAHPHGGGTGHGTPYTALRATILGAPLGEPTRACALELLATLGEAEAKVHGVDVGRVHFHELADWDSLMDLVAAGAIIARLPATHWSASALPLGGGTIRTSHGVLPVPAPVTAALLAGYAWRDDGVQGERVTPTGAAILRRLVPPERCGGAPVAGRLARIGVGAGTRELRGVSNVLRVLSFGHAATVAVEPIAVIGFEVDDMTGEEIGLACDRLRAVPGVVDVSLGACTGKKGRPASAFRLLVRPAAVDGAAEACFRETTTLGLRVREETRRVLAREEVETGEGEAIVRVKLAQRPGGERTAKAAHDDAAKLDGLRRRREARARAERSAREDG